MRQGVKWTNLSRRTISRKLTELGTPASKNIVSRLLHESGYRRRKPQKKQTMGQNADRNAQFEKIAGSGVNLLYCMDVNAKFDFVDQQANNNIVHLL